MHQTISRRLARVGIAAAFTTLVAFGNIAGAQTRGGTLNAIVQPEPPILMLGLNQQAPTQYVAGKIYQGLLTYDEKLKPLPSLAKAWKISDDGLMLAMSSAQVKMIHDLCKL